MTNEPIYKPKTHGGREGLWLPWEESSGRDVVGGWDCEL